MAREIKYGYAYARYVASDGVAIATNTLADTSPIPKNAIITSTTVHAAGPVVASGGAATVTIVAGGLDVTTDMAKTRLDTIGWVVREDMAEDESAVSDGTDIKVEIKAYVLTGGAVDLDIVVEYLLVN